MDSGRRRRDGDSSGESGTSQLPGPGKQSYIHSQQQPQPPSVWPGKQSLVEAVLAREPLPHAPRPTGIPEPTRRALATEHGSPLPDPERMSDALGADVSGARLVTGPVAADAAAAVGARAFTVGNRIFFGADASPADHKLLRHELTHVVQQQGATPSTYDHLPITSHDDGAEHEARAVADGAQAGPHAAGVAIARDPSVSDIDAKAYLGVFAAKVAIDLNARMGDVDPKLDSPYAGWSGGGNAFMTNAFHFDPANLVSQLSGFLDLEKMYRAVDKGRQLSDAPDPSGGPPQPTGKGAMVYSANVAIELGNLIVPLVTASLARVVPRYLRQRNQALLVAEKACQQWLSVAPEPKPEAIVASHPIDYRVRQGLCSGVVRFDSTAYQAGNPGEKNEVPTSKRAIDITVDQVGPMFFWVTAQTKDGKPATPEEVSEALYGVTSYAYELIAAPPRFGTKHGGDLLGKYKTLLASKGASKEFLDGSKAVTLDLADELLKDPKKADQLALEQAQGYIGTGAPKDEIVRRLGNNLVLFDAITAGAQKFGLDGNLGAARQRIADKEKELSTGDAAQAMKWDVHSSRQSALLQQISNGMTSTVAYLTNMTDKSDPHGFSLGDEIRLLLRDQATAYTTAAAQAHLLEICAQKLALASDRLQSLPFDIMEALLRQVEKTLGEVMKHKDSAQYDPTTLEKKKNELRDKVAKKRVEVLNNPTLIQGIIDELFAEVGDLKTETSMVANMDQLDEFIRQLADKKWQDYWTGYGGDPYSFGGHEDPMFMKMNAGRVKMQALRAKWTPIYAKWKTGNEASKKEAKVELKALFADPSYVQALQDTQQLLKDVAEARALVTILVTIVAMIVVTLVSMGIGTLVGATVTGALGGAVAAGTIAASTAATVGAGAALVTEAAVFTALNTFFMEDPSWSNIGKEFVFNLAVFGGMKLLSKAYRSAQVVEAALKAGGLAKGVAIGGEMSLQLIAMSAAAIAHEKIQGKQLSQEEINQIFAQSAGMFIAMAVAGRAAAPLFKELEVVGGGLGAKISGMNAERQALFTAAIAAKDKPSAAAIEALIKKDTAELKIEIDTLDLIAKNEALIEAAGIKSDVAKQISTDAGNSLYQAKVADALNQFAHPTAALQYRCTPEAKPKILAAYTSEAKVEAVAKDDITKTETIRITPPDGKGSAIRLTIGEALPEGNKVDAVAKPAGTPPTAPGGVEPPQLDGIPADQADAARWQTQSITATKPDAWSAKAKDGTTFRDAYEKWIKQGKPFIDGPNGPEPIKPSDVSAEAWREFEPELKKILGQHNLTMSMKGAANVEALKAKGIDLAKIDPSSPRYQEIRPELIATLGKEAVLRYEASLTDKPGDPARAEADKQVKRVLADGALGSLKSAFKDCEILLTGSASRPANQLGAIKTADVILIAPDGVKPETRLGLEQRANAMTVEAGEDLVKAGGSKQLRVSARVMTREQYLGIRSADPGGADVRIDENFKAATKDDVATGFDGAKAQVGKDGQLPKDVVNLLTKNLPGIDVNAPEKGIEAYLKSTHPKAKNLQVVPTGNRTYAIKDGGDLIGTFKIYDNATDMARELSALHKLGELKLDHLAVAGATDAAKVDGIGKSTTGAITSDPVRGDLVKDTVATAAKASGEARADAIEKLRADAKSVARAMAELHGKAASSDKVSVEYKDKEIRQLEQQWRDARIAGHTDRGDLDAIGREITQLKKDFKAADVDATMTLGNADVATTSVQAGGKVGVDGTNVGASLGNNGKGSAPGAEDVGRYLETLRAQGADAGLSPGEITRIEAAFMAEYKASMRGGGGTGLEATVKFYKTMRAVEAVRDSAKQIDAVGKDTAKKADAERVHHTRVESLKADLGLSSSMSVPTDAADLDPALIKRFEGWLADPATSVGDNPATKPSNLARLRDYYGRDPRGAIELAKKQYGFDGVKPAKDDPGLITDDPGKDAERMLAYLEHADPAFNSGKKLTPAEIKEFTGKYVAGERFDPATRRWYLPGEPAKVKNIFPRGKFTAEQVYDVLMGKVAEPSPPVEPGTKAPPPKFQASFKPFVEMLRKLAINGKSPFPVADANIITAIHEVAFDDAYVDTVRHEVKQKFKERALDSLVNPDKAALAKDPRYSSLPWAAKPADAFEESRFLRMREAVDGLDSGDGGNLVEDWRARVADIHDPTLRHITVTPDNVDPSVGLKGKNILDMVEGTKIVDNKDYSGALGKDNEPQLEEQLRLAGEGTGQATSIDVPVKDASGNEVRGAKPRTLHLDGVRWSVTDPRGVEASAKWMVKQLRAHPDLLEFEIWNWKGEKTIVRESNTAILEDPAKLSAWLGPKPPRIR